MTLTDLKFFKWVITTSQLMPTMPLVTSINNNNNTLRVRTRWKVVVGTASNTPYRARGGVTVICRHFWASPFPKPISLGFWEGRTPKRGDAHITVTAGKAPLPHFRWKTLGTRFRQSACKFVQVIAWFAVIFGINTTSDISKLLWWNFQLNFEISRVIFKQNITYKSCYY